jgi:hypothetical protein
MKKINTGNWFYDMIFSAYFSKKENDSRLVAKNSPKMPIPKQTGIEFEIINKTAKYIMSTLKYKADPLTFDYYTHPETVLSEIQTKGNVYGNDCDDFACFAYKMLNDSGISQDNISVVSIITSFIPDLSQLQWCHVILVGFYHDKDNNQLWAYTIDTNGLFWYPMNISDVWKSYYEKLKLIDKDIKTKFNYLYKTNYVLLIDHGYPF